MCKFILQYYEEARAMAIEKVHPDKAPQLGFPGREMVIYLNYLSFLILDSAESTTCSVSQKCCSTFD